MTEAATGTISLEGGVVGGNTISGFEHVEVHLGSGDDNIAVGEGLSAWIDGGAGSDTLVGSSGIDSLYGGDGNDSIDAGGGDEWNIGGGAGDDTVVGGDGNDGYLTGGDGDDSLDGGSGNDRLLFGEEGNDVLSGGAGDDSELYGGNGDDTILGGEGNDSYLSGNDGNDMIVGGAGYDYLIGGAGNDAFVFDSLVAWDTVADFTSGGDTLRISLASLAVGNGDTTIDGASVISGPGGFDASSELVIVTGDLASGRANDADWAAQAIGDANQSYAVGQTAIFAVDDGSTSALYCFQSANDDATVSSAELTLLAVLQNAPSTVIGDYVFGA
jgi:Ca2+-binding RTX toxin-like protein